MLRMSAVASPLLATMVFVWAQSDLRGQRPSGEQPRDGQPKMTREVREKEYLIRLDLTRQVLRVSIPEQTVIGEKAGTVEEPLHPTLRDILPEAFVPVSVLVQKAKQFDDGLYAAVDIAAQKGAGSFAGKAALLGGLSRRVVAAPLEETAPSLLMAAGRLGGLSLDVPPSRVAKVDELTTTFLRNELHSKPLGFYTWTKELEAIFRQDRLLQTELAEKDFRAVVEALRADADLRRTYEGYLALVSKLTNPFPQNRRDLLPLLASQGKRVFEPDEFTFFPPSKSHEGELFKKLDGIGPIPERFSLVDEMIKRIRSAQLKLEPTDESGWYDYQTWAHEPMVIPEKMPEAARLHLDEGYRRELLELFKGAQALARETHVKQLEIPEATSSGRLRAPVLTITPGLTVEPLASYYLRRARGYQFVRAAIEGVFGSVGLAQMRRLTMEGPLPDDLGTQLQEMESLFWGAYLTACRQIGLPPERALPDAARSGAHVERFAAWMKALDSDTDLGRDARMMVPVFCDGKRTKVWVFLGWVSRYAVVDFETPPTAQAFDPAGRPVPLGGDVRVEFGAESHTLVYPVTAEVYVTRLLNRQEFRTLCDRYRTRSAILANLP
jgi:hypothetical protein